MCVCLFTDLRSTYTLDKISQMCKKELTNVTWPTNRK